MKFQAIVVAVLLTGCAGTITGDDGSGGGGSGSGDLQKLALLNWETKAYPVLANKCSSCHGGGNAAAPPFLKATDMDGMRTVLLGWSTPAVVNTDTPSGSEILTKGSHEGVQALDAVDSAAVLGWIQAEHDADAAGTMTTDLTTGKVPLLLCTGGTPGTSTCPINIITLDNLQLPGASIQFVAQAYGSDTYITDLELLAGPAGVYLDHPLFATYPATGDAIVDSFDRYDGFTLNLAATTTTPTCIGPSCQYIGAGAAAFVGFPPTQDISISFKALEAAHADTPPPASVGCKTNGFAKFLSDVKPLFTANGCTNCHGSATNNAHNSLDLTGLASTTDNTTCLQVRGKVDFTNEANSAILNPPEGKDAAHPAAGTLTGTALTNFQTKIAGWEAVEVNNN